MRKILFLLFLLLTACSTPRSPNADAAAINVQLGLAYLERGNTARAKNKLLLALAQNPTGDLTQDAMGYFFEKTDDIKNAEKYYAQAITTHSGTAYNNYGAFLYRQQKYHDALKYFTLAIQDPDYLHTDLARKNAALAKEKIEPH